MVEGDYDLVFREGIGIPEPAPSLLIAMGVGLVVTWLHKGTKLSKFHHLQFNERVIGAQSRQIQTQAAGENVANLHSEGR